MDPHASRHPKGWTMLVRRVTCRDRRGISLAPTTRVGIESDPQNLCGGVESCGLAISEQGGTSTGDTHRAIEIGRVN